MSEATALEVITERSPAEILASLKLGKIIGEPNEEYHAAPCISTSKLKVFRKSPFLYHGRFITKSIPSPEATPALLFGSAADTLIIEGKEVFEREYYVIPEGVGNQSKADKELRAMLAASNPGKKSVTFKEMGKLTRMAENVAAHPFAAPMLAACQPQITWRLKRGIFHVQARTDGWAEEGCALTDGMPFIFDLKTIPELPDDEPDIIARQISDFWYHGQEWLYRNIISAVMGYKDDYEPRMFFGFVEKDEPFGVQVVELDEVGHGIGFRQVKDTFEKLKDCHLHNRWPLHWPETWQKKVPEVALPPYYVKRELNDEHSLW